MANEDKVSCLQLCWNPGWSRCMLLESRKWFPIYKPSEAIQKKKSAGGSGASKSSPGRGSM